MNNVPSALEQKNRIESCLGHPISEECYMISKKWWDNWIDYVSTKNKDESSLGPINNLDLM